MRMFSICACAILFTAIASAAVARPPVDGAADSPKSPVPGSLLSRGCGDGQCRTARGEDYGTCPSDCGSMADRVAFLKQIAASEFELDEGAIKIFEPADCANVPRCFYNNPTSPYGIPLIPLGPGEPDPDPLDIRDIPRGTRDLYGGYRLAPDEAVLWIGMTPPECPYFSFTAYVFSRIFPEALGNPPYGDRATVFASLGDSQNQLTLNTSAGKGEPAFEKECVVITTGDRGTDRKLREFLEASGFAGSLNTLILPQHKADGVTPHARMGYANEADLFAVLMRIAHPDAQQAGLPIRAWLDNPGGFVFRVRPRTPAALDPFPMPAERPQGTGQREDASALGALTRAIEDVYAEVPHAIKVALPLRRADGDYCLDNLRPCFGDCRDTVYLETSFELGPSPEELIVVGRNHEITGKASYVNITITRARGSTAYYSVVMRDLKGSTDEFIPDHPDRDGVWLLRFSRDCQDRPYCYEISEEQVPFNEPLVVLVRAYLEPATRTKARDLPIPESEIEYTRVFKVFCADSRCE